MTQRTRGDLVEVAEDLDGRADTELEEEAGWRRLLGGGEEKSTGRKVRQESVGAAGRGPVSA